MASIRIADSFHQTYPDAFVGVMILENVVNPNHNEALEQAKVALEEQLQEKFPEKTVLRTHPVIQAYTAYYKNFKKSYHVLAQLESLIFNGRSIPSVAGLVESMFMAELDNMLLTAGHDLDTVEMPVTIDITKGNESYVMLNGNEQILKAGDMVMADQCGILSSVIYGPDLRSRIKSSTKKAMFVVYAPAGIQKALICNHFEDIQKFIRLFSPLAEMQYLEYF